MSYRFSDGDAAATDDTAATGMGFDVYGGTGIAVKVPRFRPGRKDAGLPSPAARAG